MSKINKKSRNTPRTAAGKGRGNGPAPTTKGESAAARAQQEVCEKCGQVHRRCRGHTKHGPNTGKPCGANPPAGQNLCIKHGGNQPAHRRRAKERLLELVDPALAALHRVLTNPNADDAVKVRAALGVLDRTGLKPGVSISVETSKWDDLVQSVTGEVVVDRSLPPADRREALGWEDVQQLAAETNADAWREYDHEDAEEYEHGRIRPDENTVKGEVVVTRYHRPADREPSDPPPPHSKVKTRTTEGRLARPMRE